MEKWTSNCEKYQCYRQRIHFKRYQSYHSKNNDIKSIKSIEIATADILSQRIIDKMAENVNTRNNQGYHQLNITSKVIF